MQVFSTGYQAIFGTALSRGGNRQYGNLILSRIPVLQVFNHLLPHPAEGGIKHMQRQAIEAVVQTGAGPLRVMNTHLEYYSAAHRSAQIGRLRELQAEVAANEASPPKGASSPYDAVPRPASLVLCGDFNLLPDDAEYQALFQAPLLDGWRYLRKNETDPLTTGLHDRVQWPMGGHCRDYFAVTPDLARAHPVDRDGRRDRRLGPPAAAPRAGPALTQGQGVSGRSCRRSTLPIGDLGSASRKNTRRGCLYGASCLAQCAISAASSSAGSFLTT